jgi:hypothetical protein
MRSNAWLSISSAPRSYCSASIECGGTLSAKSCGSALTSRASCCATAIFSAYLPGRNNRERRCKTAASRSNRVVTVARNSAREAFAPSGLWITCEHRVSSLWIALYRKKIFCLTPKPARTAVGNAPTVYLFRPRHKKGAIGHRHRGRSIASRQCPRSARQT